MKKIITLTVFIIIPFVALPQCNTSNATTCKCLDTTQTDCDLLPNIQIGHPPFYQTGTFGIIEYSQTGNGDDNGRLKITVSTPNTGVGPLEIRTTNIFVCGTDTFIGTPPSICPNGIDYPKILINQRIYHKNGNSMSFYDVPSGTMTYHPSHGHMHVDNWGVYTLRENNGNPDPLTWPIIGTGTKLAFCVEDYGTCIGYSGHCLDTLGNVLDQPSDFPNYGLGGGNYNCSSVVQGITSGYVDIYWTSLDGMWINIPPTTCNGNYWIVIEVDPNQNFIEEREDDNVYAFPYTLTQQIPSGGYAEITPCEIAVCPGAAVELAANASYSGNLINPTYQWSTGDTTASIMVSAAGVYNVTVTSQCGTTTSVPAVVNVMNINPPLTTGDTVCVSGMAVLSATAAGTINWYDSLTGGSLVGTGATFITPVLTATAIYYAESKEKQNDFNTPHDNTFGTGANHNLNDKFLIFDVNDSIKLVSVKVYAQTAGNRTIQLRDESDQTLQSFTANLPNGESRVYLNWIIPPGVDYRMGLSNASAANLFRNNSGVTYPYVLSDCLLEITGSSAGPSFYYFYYDWEIESAGDSCASTRSAATAYVDQCLSVNEQDGSNIVSIVPNPGNGELNFSFSDPGVIEADISVIDGTGKTIYAKRFQNLSPGKPNRILLHQAASGMYLLQLKWSSGVLIRKIIIE